VRAEDCLLVWKWANDPVTRALSFSSEPIPWEHHMEWFKNKLIDPQSFFYIVQDHSGVPVGQIRFQIKGREAVVSVSIEPAHRRLGYGTQLIRLGAEKIFNSLQLELIHAYIKQGNEVSIRAFDNAGFSQVGTKEMDGNRAIHFMLKREDYL
jgi:UDP-2,4-diacetamido-2,4,6-trideoxy-beta-L-altropyranose hydrolase